MDDCCTAKGDELSSLKNNHKKVLLFVLIINASLFGIELGAGFLANSTALIADSLDMLGDAFVYGFSLYVLWERGMESEGSIVERRRHGSLRHGCAFGSDP